MALLDEITFARSLRIALLATLGMLAIYVEAAPLGLSPVARPSPDLLLCMVAYFAVRRPGSCPVLLVFALGLVRDLLTDVPVGAGALSLVLATEALRHWSRHLQRGAFLREWMAVSAAAAATALMQWLMVLLTLAQPPYLADLAEQTVFTAAAYALVALVLRWLLRIGWRRVEAI